MTREKHTNVLARPLHVRKWAMQRKPFGGLEFYHISRKVKYRCIWKQVNFYCNTGWSESIWESEIINGEKLKYIRTHLQEDIYSLTSEYQLNYLTIEYAPPPPLRRPTQSFHKGLFACDYVFWLCIFVGNVYRLVAFRWKKGKRIRLYIPLIHTK